MKWSTVMIAVFACAAMTVSCNDSDDADRTVTVAPTMEVTTPAPPSTPPAATAVPIDEACPPNSPGLFTMAYDATAQVVVAVADERNVVVGSRDGPVDSVSNFAPFAEPLLDSRVFA